MLAILKETEKLSASEKATLEEIIARCIETHRHNRQMVTHLTLAGVTALTASEARVRELRRQGFFTRLWKDFIGKNRDIQAQIDFDQAQAQYASQQLLEQFAEQHLLTFDLVTAVNNKLNMLTLEVDEELNRMYEALGKFFARIRSDVISIQNQLGHLERNVTLLQWSHTIGYQRYDDTEYADLPDIEKIVCVTNDFFQCTQGNWSTNDLMLLKSTLAEPGLAIKATITAQFFFLGLLKNPNLVNKLFQGISNKHLSDLQLFDSPLLKGIEKIILLESSEAYIVDSVLDLLKTAQAEYDRYAVQSSLIRYYLLRNADMQSEREVSIFDFVLELLLGLQMVLDASQELSDDAPLPEKPVLQEESEQPERVSESIKKEQHLTPQDFRMLGIWYFEWYWPRLNFYTGTLEIIRKLEKHRYSGTFIMPFASSADSAGDQFTADTEIAMQGHHVRISCSRSASNTWLPELFELELDPYDDVMTGISKHAKEVQAKITFTKQGHDEEAFF